MKKLIKGFMTIAMIFMFAIVLTGCGKEETPNNGGNGEYHGNTEGAKDLKNVSNSNYKEVTKNVFGISTKDATGWVIKKAESINGVNNLEINYTVTNGEDAKTVLEYYFDQCKSVSKDGIYEVVTNFETYSTSKGTKYDTFDDYFAVATKIGSLYQVKWIYDNNGKNIQFNVSINETYARISFSMLG